MEKTGRRTFIMLLALGIILAAGAHASRAGTGARTGGEAGEALCGALGTSSLCLSPECSGARSMSDGTPCSMADVPAGYCYHQVCNVVAPPPVPGASLHRMRVIRQPAP